MSEYQILTVLAAFAFLYWRIFAYAAASLTVIRMISLYLSAIGLGLRTDTKLFLGWFGPRGLASIVFAVMAAGEHLPAGNTLIATAVWTIVLSVVAHGLSSNPLAALYSERVGEGAV